MAYGVGMTDKMLTPGLPERREAGVIDVEFVEGLIEDVLLPDSSVDVVNSNCVINLSINKAAVFAETDRVLRPIGRLGGSDIVAENHLDPAQRAERGGYVGAHC
jgi:ubiquinone/menaquinone biosynthesis C-methylase UbiE